MGIPQAMILRVAGFSLLGFAIALLLNATRAEIDRNHRSGTGNRRGSLLASISPRVLGSVVLISVQLLTASGNWAVVALADIVLLFAVAQTLGLRRAASRRNMK